MVHDYAMAVAGSAMNNSLINNVAVEATDLPSGIVQRGYFRSRLDFFEAKYIAAFPRGWGQFFMQYSKGKTPPGNMEYDEWAFLCEHFWEELTQSWPTGDCENSKEEPEVISGFSFEGRIHCLTGKSTSTELSTLLLGVRLGPRCDCGTFGSN